MTSLSNRFRIILVILTAFCVYGIVAGIRASIGVLSPMIADFTGNSYGTVNSVYSLCNLIYAVSGPFFGFLTLKKSHVFVMNLGLIFCVVGFLGFVLIQNLISLYVFQGIFLGLGAAGVCYSIVYAAAAPLLPSNLASLFSGILSVSQGTFNIITTQFLHIYGDSGGNLMIPFICLSVILACIVPFCFLFKAKNQYAEEYAAKESVVAAEYVSVRSILKTMVHHPFFYLLCFGFLVYGFCDGNLVYHLYERSSEFLGLDSQSAALLVMIYGASSMFGPLLGGLIASKTKNLRFCIGTGFLIWSISTIISNLFLISDMAVMILQTVIFGISMSMCVPYFVILAQERVPITKFAPVFSVVSIFPILGYAINSLCGGLCFDITGSFFASDLFFLIISLIFSALFFITGFRFRKKQANNEVLSRI